MTLEKLREHAKKLGIRNWHNMKEENLKVKIAEREKELYEIPEIVDAKPEDKKAELDPEEQKEAEFVINGQKPNQFRTQVAEAQKVKATGDKYTYRVTSGSLTIGGGRYKAGTDKDTFKSDRELVGKYKVEKV